jgi:acyl-CoA reductase-like NAD-dependent aldehyde dehydrogenase
VLKPGPQEPWTPYRMAEAFFQAGIPREAIAIYPGAGDVGAAVLDSCSRNLIFGGTATVDRYRGNVKVQAHGPGFSKILLGDDQVDRWEQFLDMMVDSVFLNSGRGCINCSGIWASRHTRAIADALARRLAAIRPLPPEHPEASLAAFTVPGTAAAISQAIDAQLQAPGVTEVTAQYREGPRLVTEGRADYLLPTVVHCDSPEAAIAKTEYMFPFVTVVTCPEAKMLEAIGPTLVGSAITCNPQWRRSLLDAVHIDRLNLGPVPTTQLNWLQPHEGNLIDFLFRARAFQTAEVPAANATVESVSRGAAVS